MQMASSKAPQRAPGKMALTSITRGKIEKPVRVVLYGVEGVGKSTFAADAPSPIFLGAEDGTAQLDTARFPEPSSWADVLEAIDTLERETHDYKTLAVDTLDWLEPLVWEHVCRAAGKKDIEDFGFGKGYVAALDEWRRFLARLDALRARRGMQVVLLAHSWTKMFKNPEADDFERYELKLHAKAGGLVKEWADAVLFARFEVFAHEKNGRVRGVSTGARVLHTVRTAAYDAKNRHDLPDTLPLEWRAFAEAVAAHRPAPPATLRARIEALLPRADEATRGRVKAALVKVGDDAAELARIASKLQAMVGINESETGAEPAKEVA